MIIKRFYSKFILRYEPTDETKVIPIENEEVISVERREKEQIVGEYEIINESVYSIFRYKKSNYLFLKDKTIKITNSVKIDYRVNYSKYEPSYLEIFDNNKSIVKEQYYNYRDPLINPLDGHEDWEYVNFAYHLANYIDKIKKDSSIVLF